MNPMHIFNRRLSTANKHLIHRTHSLCLQQVVSRLSAQLTASSTSCTKVNNVSVLVWILECKFNADMTNAAWPKVALLNSFLDESESNYFMKYLCNDGPFKTHCLCFSFFVLMHRNAFVSPFTANIWRSLLNFWTWSLHMYKTLWFCASD